MPRWRRRRPALRTRVRAARCPTCRLFQGAPRSRRKTQPQPPRRPARPKRRHGPAGAALRAMRFGRPRPAGGPLPPASASPIRDTPPERWPVEAAPQRLQCVRQTNGPRSSQEPPQRQGHQARRRPFAGSVRPNRTCKSAQMSAVQCHGAKPPASAPRLIPDGVLLTNSGPEVRRAWACLRRAVVDRASLRSLRGKRAQGFIFLCVGVHTRRGSCDASSDRRNPIAMLVVKSPGDAAHGSGGQFITTLSHFNLFGLSAAKTWSETWQQCDAVACPRNKTGIKRSTAEPCGTSGTCSCLRIVAPGRRVCRPLR